MDFETQRKKRMEALDDKRKRLEEMRKMRKDRTESAEEVQESQQASVDERAQVDDLVNSLLVSTISEPAIEGTPATDATSPRYLTVGLHDDSPIHSFDLYFDCFLKR
jgi:hypothetical protein